jgi:hypothetical protein
METRGKRVQNPTIEPTDTPVTTPQPEEESLRRT